MAKKTPVDLVNERAAAAAAAASATPAEEPKKEPEAPQMTAHPDVVLLDEVAEAKNILARLEDRVNAVIAAERAKSAQYTEEQVLAAKNKFNTWVNNKYSGRIRRAFIEGIDLDGFEANPKTGDIDVHPTMLALAKSKMVGLVNTSSVQELNKRMCDYIIDATDEDGSKVLNEFDQNEIKRLYLPVPTPPAKNGAKQDRVEKADKPNKESGERQYVTTYPGTNVQVKINHNPSTNKFFIRGAGVGTTYAKLVAAGANISEDQMKVWVAEIGPSLV